MSHEHDQMTFCPCCGPEIKQQLRRMERMLDRLMHHVADPSKIAELTADLRASGDELEDAVAANPLPKP